MLKVKLNDDKELVEEINNQLLENQKKYGKRYCPCKLDRIPENICPCKELQDMNVAGECHCGKYVKYNTEKEN